MRPSELGRHGKGSTYFPTTENGTPATSMPAANVSVYKHVGNQQYQLVKPGDDIQFAEQRKLEAAGVPILRLPRAAMEIAKAKIDGDVTALDRMTVQFVKSFETSLARQAEPVKATVVGGTEPPEDLLGREAAPMSVVEGLLPRSVDYYEGTEIIRNPTSADYQAITAEYRREFPMDRSGDPTTRFTTDAAGNRWIWRSDAGIHSFVEPLISAREGVPVNQNAANFARGHSPRSIVEVPRLYREMSADSALELHPMTRADSPYGVPDQFFSTTPELALGQGMNKGVLMEFSGGFPSRPSASKPGSDLVARMGGGEERTARVQPSELRKHLVAMTVQKRAFGTRSELFRLNKWISQLESEGWVKTVDTRGGITVRKPVDSAPAPAPAPEPAPLSIKETPDEIFNRAFDKDATAFRASDEAKALNTAWQAKGGTSFVLDKVFAQNRFSAPPVSPDTGSAAARLWNQWDSLPMWAKARPQDTKTVEWGRKDFFKNFGGLLGVTFDPAETAMNFLQTAGLEVAEGDTGTNEDHVLEALAFAVQGFEKKGAFRDALAGMAKDELKPHLDDLARRRVSKDIDSRRITQRLKRMYDVVKPGTINRIVNEPTMNVTESLVSRDDLKIDDVIRQKDNLFVVDGFNPDRSPVVTPLRASAPFDTNPGAVDDPMADPEMAKDYRFGMELPPVTPFYSVQAVFPLDMSVDAQDMAEEARAARPEEEVPFSVREMPDDAAYMKAVEAGDMATAQRMVDVAAKGAGYNVGPVFHHGAFDASVDAVPVVGDEGMHFGTEDAARQRAYGKLVDEFILAGEVVYDEDLGAWFWASNGTDSFDVRGEEGFASKAAAQADLEEFATGEQDAESDPEDLGVFTRAFLKPGSLIYVDDQGGSWKKAIAQAEEQGHNAIEYKNLFEDKNSTSYVVFSPSQIKSAEPVTHDDAGNVIPLSQRFNPQDNDIRRSIREVDSDLNFQRNYLRKDTSFAPMEQAAKAILDANGAATHSEKLANLSKYKFIGREGDGTRAFAYDNLKMAGQAQLESKDKAAAAAYFGTPDERVWVAKIREAEKQSVAHASMQGLTLGVYSFIAKRNALDNPFARGTYYVGMFRDIAGGMSKEDITNLDLWQDAIIESRKDAVEDVRGELLRMGREEFERALVSHHDKLRTDWLREQFAKRKTTAPLSVKEEAGDLLDKIFSGAFVQYWNRLKSPMGDVFQKELADAYGADNVALIVEQMEGRAAMFPNELTAPTTPKVKTPAAQAAEVLLAKAEEKYRKKLDQAIANDFKGELQAYYAQKIARALPVLSMDTAARAAALSPAERSAGIDKAFTALAKEAYADLLKRKDGKALAASGFLTLEGVTKDLEGIKAILKEREVAFTALSSALATAMRDANVTMADVLKASNETFGYVKTRLADDVKARVAEQLAKTVGMEEFPDAIDEAAARAGRAVEQMLETRLADWIEDGNNPQMRDYNASRRAAKTLVDVLSGANAPEMTAKPYSATSKGLAAGPARRCGDVQERPRGDVAGRPDQGRVVGAGHHHAHGAGPWAARHGHPRRHRGRCPLDPPAPRRGPPRGRGASCLHRPHRDRAPGAAGPPRTRARGRRTGDRIRG
jgi:hypothetical protein